MITMQIKTQGLGTYAATEPEPSGKDFFLLSRHRELSSVRMSLKLISIFDDFAT
jgi:hypothetical protein